MGKLAFKLSYRKIVRADGSRCCRFGAVLEEFEVHDAIATVLAEKDGMVMGAGDQHNVNMQQQAQLLYAQTAQ